MEKFQLNWEKHEEVFSFGPKMEKYSLSWDDHKKNIGEAFVGLRKDKHFCDVILACEDHQFQAHKIVLSAGSLFFDQVLKSHKHPSPLVYLKGVEAKHMELLLDFMYCGEVALEQEELESFLRSGEELGVKGLAITVTPVTFDGSPKKKIKPLLDNSAHLGLHENSSSVVSTDKTYVPSLQPEDTPLESTSSFEQNMMKEDCVVKSEEMEKLPGGDVPQNQVLEKWEDLEKYVIFFNKGEQGSGDRRSLGCFLCGKVMESSLSRMMAHIEAKHFREFFTHTCDVCQDTFKTKSILVNHIKSFHPELSSFSMKSGVLEESAGESRQIPGEWEDLEKYVIVKRDHESGGKKSFQCSLCGKVMDRSLGLMMAHVEAKHFRELFTHNCDICQDTFKTKAILMSHIKKIHNDQTLLV